MTGSFDCTNVKLILFSPGRFAADSYHSLQAGSSLAVAGTSHVYQAAESSFDHHSQPYPDLATGNEAQVMQANSYMNGGAVGSSSVQQSNSVSFKFCEEKAKCKTFPAPFTFITLLKLLCFWVCFVI